MARYRNVNRGVKVPTVLALMTTTRVVCEQLSEIADAPTPAEGSAKLLPLIDTLGPFAWSLRDYFERELDLDANARTFVSRAIPDWVRGETECGQVAMLARELGTQAKMLAVCTLERSTPSSGTARQRDALQAASIALARVALDLQSAFGDVGVR